MRCTEGDCQKPAARGERCWAHWKRLHRIQRGKSKRSLSEPIRAYGTPPWQKAWDDLSKAAEDYANAETDADWEETKRRLIRAARAYVERRRHRR